MSASRFWFDSVNWIQAWGNTPWIHHIAEMPAITPRLEETHSWVPWTFFATYSGRAVSGPNHSSMIAPPIQPRPRFCGSPKL